jgi:hypothetical protein
MLLVFITRFLRLKGRMVKYSYKGRRKAVEKFTTRQGFGILVTMGGILIRPEGT